MKLFRIILTALCFMANPFVATAAVPTSIIAVSPEPNVLQDVHIVALPPVEELLTQALVQEGLEEPLKLELKAYQKGITLKHGATSYQASVQSITFDARLRRFKAVMSFASTDDAEFVDVEGKYEEMVEIPVLATALPNKVAIAEENLTRIAFPKSKLKHDTIQDEAELIGFTLKRSMPSMRPVRRENLLIPSVVQKDATVDVIYRTSSLELKTVGVALEQGGLKDIIRVRNVESNKIVRAVVRAENRVEVLSEGAGSGGLKLSEVDHAR